MTHIDDTLVLRLERLRDDVESLKNELRSRYPNSSRQVVSPDIRERAASIAERWLVEIAVRSDVAAALGGNELADRSVLFQQLLTHSERATIRRKYDATVSGILRDFRAAVVVPLKARRNSMVSVTAPAVFPVAQTIRRARIAFVGQSFLPADEPLNSSIASILRALGLTVLTGEKPRATSVSKKVRERIDRSDVFVGIFSRRDRLEGKAEWNTSAWVIDEKAYAFAKGKKLVLLRETGVGSIGGVQGDYEYLEFERDRVDRLIIQIVETFRDGEDAGD
jgi:hypothetical protein